MTIVTQDGKLIAAAAGDARRATDGGPTPTGAVRAGLLALDGQQLRVVEVDDSVAAIGKATDGDQYGRRLSAYLAARGLL